MEGRDVFFPKEDGGRILPNLPNFPPEDGAWRPRPPGWRGVKSAKILLLPCEIIFVTLYCDSNIGLFSIAPHLVIALPTLR